jgi:hypothetical protein
MKQAARSGIRSCWNTHILETPVLSDDESGDYEGIERSSVQSTQFRNKLDLPIRIHHISEIGGLRNIVYGQIPGCYAHGFAGSAGA